MGKPSYFNKGTAKGIIKKAEIIEFDSKQAGKGKGKFLSLEINTGGTNRVKCTVFGTKTSPSKPQDFLLQFPVGSKVEAVGNVKEAEFETNNGKKGIDRSISVNSIKPLTGEEMNASFILQGIVSKIKDKDGQLEVSVDIDSSYTPDGGTLVERIDNYNLIIEEEYVELLDLTDLEKGCNAKFKGRIINELELDEYNDVKSSKQMFKVQLVENIITKDDLEDSPF